jgi:hypothetical protein
MLISAIILHENDYLKNNSFCNSKNLKLFSFSIKFYFMFFFYSPISSVFSSFLLVDSGITLFKAVPADVAEK